MSLADLDRVTHIDAVVGLPGWALRVPLLAAGVGLAVAAPAGGRPLAVPIILSVLALATALLPWTPAPEVQLGFACLVRIIVGHDDVDARLLVSALLVALVHVLSALAAVIPLAGRLDPHALAPSARRFGFVVLGFVPVALAARFAGPGLGSDLLFLLAALACTALVALGLLAGRRRR